MHIIWMNRSYIRINLKFKVLNSIPLNSEKLKSFYLNKLNCLKSSINTLSKFYRSQFIVHFLIALNLNITKNN